MAKIVGIPKSEDGHGVLYRGCKNNYVISQNTNKNQFTLWKIAEDNSYEKIGTSDSPTKLYDKIEKLEKSS